MPTRALQCLITLSLIALTSTATPDSLWDKLKEAAKDTVEETVNSQDDPQENESKPQTPPNQQPQKQTTAHNTSQNNVMLDPQYPDLYGLQIGMTSFEVVSALKERYPEAAMRTMGG